MKTILMGGIAAAAMIAMAPALAQAPVAGPAKVQTRAEVQAKVTQHFAQLDTNRDGFVVKAEADAGMAAMHARMGGESAGPGKHDRGQMFERLDANKDGSISRAEFDAAHAKRQQRMGQRSEGKRGMRRMGGMMGGMMGGRMFTMADADKDGRVSLAEATAMALQHFDMADANRDGQVTPEERLQMRQKMRAQHKAS